VLQQHVSAPLPTLPADLARYQPFLARLLAKGRGERFADATEIVAAARALQPAAAGEPSRAAETGTADEPRDAGEVQPTAA